MEVENLKERKSMKAIASSLRISAKLMSLEADQLKNERRYILPISRIKESASLLVLWLLKRQQKCAVNAFMAMSL